MVASNNASRGVSTSPVIFVCARDGMCSSSSSNVRLTSTVCGDNGEATTGVGNRSNSTLWGEKVQLQKTNQRKTTG